MLKKLLGLAPKEEADGSYSPSPLALKLATVNKIDFDGGHYDNPYIGEQHKILMICTEEKNMLMANGKKFSTGNHPVEMLVPMLHLSNAGFDIDIVTPSGKPVQIEMWAMPQEDEDVKNIYQDFKDKFEKPGNLSEWFEESEKSSYCAIFFPGGHGEMIGIPNNKTVGNIIQWAHKSGLHTLSLCHGPAALLAANIDNSEEYIYQGYTIAAFPDSVDKQTPMIGYMPGHMPWKFGEKLEVLGLTIINKKADDTCYVDRNLITGASPKAANAFGRLAAMTLLNKK